MPIAYTAVQPATSGFDLYIVDANSSQGEDVVAKYGTDQLLMIRSKKQPGLEVALCFTNGTPTGTNDTSTVQIPRCSLAFNIKATSGDSTHCANDRAQFSKTVQGAAGTEKWAPVTNENDA